MSFRKAIFWAHLITGVVVGIVVLLMSATGILLAYQRQILVAAERQVSTVPATNEARLQPEALLQKVQESFPNDQPTALTIRRETSSAVMVNFGRERAVFVNPFTGATIGEASKWRGFLHTVEQLHRNLAAGPTGKMITGACNLGFLGLVISGLYLWLPRRWSKPNLKAIAVPNLQLAGKPRHFNWHNSIGLWCAIPLIILVITGVVMSYTWANDLIYRITGNPVPPPRAAASTDRKTVLEKINTAGLNQLLESGGAKVAGWKTMTVRFPESAAAKLSLTIDEGNGSRPDKRTSVSVNPKTRAEQWESFDSLNSGRQLRMWMKPVHTGEALGVFGQTVAALVSLGACVLVYTGFALCWRRFRDRGKASPM